MSVLKRFTCSTRKVDCSRFHTLIIASTELGLDLFWFFQVGDFFVPVFHFYLSCSRQRIPYRSAHCAVKLKRLSHLWSIGGWSVHRLKVYFLRWEKWSTFRGRRRDDIFISLVCVVIIVDFAAWATNPVGFVHNWFFFHWRWRCCTGEWCCSKSLDSFDTQSWPQIGWPHCPWGG